MNRPLCGRKVPLRLLFVNLPGFLSRRRDSERRQGALGPFRRSYAFLNFDRDARKKESRRIFVGIRSANRFVRSANPHPPFGRSGGIRPNVFANGLENRKIARGECGKTGGIVNVIVFRKKEIGRQSFRRTIRFRGEIRFERRWNGRRPHRFPLNRDALSRIVRRGLVRVILPFRTFGIMSAMPVLTCFPRFEFVSGNLGKSSLSGIISRVFSLARTE